MDQTALLIAAAVVATAAVAGRAVVKVVPAGHRGVVTRAGRVARSRRPGLAAVVPGVERIQMVALRPRPIDPLTVTATTRDGVEVRLVLSVFWRVADPVRAVRGEPETRTATADAVERALRHLVATVDLASLLRDREPMLARLAVRTGPLLGPVGVELVDVDLLDTEVRVGPELLRLLA